MEAGMSGTVPGEKLRKTNMGRRVKKSRKDDVAEEVEDRLSNLPEDILHLIFSYFDTRDVVQTCILSTRWRYFWTTVPFLDFDSCRFRRKFDYKNFVRNVLDKRDPNTDVGKFHLFLSVYVDNHLRNKCLNYAAAHKVNHLSVWLGYGKFHPIPEPLLRCQTLQFLDLWFFKIPKSFAFTNVTTLYLRNCLFDFQDDCYDISANFPNLIKLYLFNWRCSGLKVLKISGSSIVDLSICRTYGRDRTESSLCKVEISASNVTSFSCEGVLLKFSAISLPSLQHAWLLIREGVDRRKKNVILNLLRGISAAQFVTLSTELIMALNDVSGLEHQPTLFTRLKSLKLRTYGCNLTRLPEKVETYLLGKWATIAD